MSIMQNLGGEISPSPKGPEKTLTAQSMSIMQVVESAGLFPAESLYGLVGDV